MNRFRSRMGRRQFLVGSMASASAMALTNLVKGKGAAVAAETPEGGSGKGVGGGYPHLLSPLHLRNKVVKNRMLYTVSTPYFLMGPETFPADVIRSYYADIAKSAAIVMVRMSTDMGGGGGGAPRGGGQTPQGGEMSRGDGGTAPQAGGGMPQGGGMPGYAAQMPAWDGDDSRVNNYIDQMIEGIHCEGALVGGANIGGGMGGGPGGGGDTLSIEEIVTQAKEAEDKGYDVAYVGGRNAQNTEDLKPILEKMEAVRKATNLIIVSWILPAIEGVSQGAGGPMGNTGGGITGPSVEEVVRMAKMLEGVADIIQMRDNGRYTSHPDSFNQEQGKPAMLECARAIKAAGIDIVTAPNGGFNDPDLNEAFIAEGKTDMVAMARALIADPEYALKLGEGRRDDVTPCVMCNECHGASKTDGPWLTFCAVNPKLGLPSSVRSIRTPVTAKRVAVIGGGPGGMKAALTAAERGRRVTLYEKNDALGGLQAHTDHCPLKWSFRDYKNYLIRQVEKAGIEVKLKTAATPQMIKKIGYDAVLVAIGSEPAMSRLPGAGGDNVFDIMAAYTQEKFMGKNVVLVGGGNYGADAGLFLAHAGHDVTVITSAEKLITSGPHDRGGQLGMSQSMDNFSYELKAIPTRISGGKVFYTDADGREKSVKADSVVVYAGLKPRQAEALRFADSAGQVLYLGDCTGRSGAIQRTIRSAYFMASQV